MKRFCMTLTICILALNCTYAQIDDMVLQPTHIVGKRINASGQVTSTLEADFTYREDGKVVTFGLPQYGLTSAYLYTDDYLIQEGVCHASGDPNYGSNPTIMEFYEYSYFEDGNVKHITHEWSEMNATENWAYTYDEYGRLKQKDYKEGSDVYHQHYIYDYENEDKTHIESYWTSWVPQGLKLRKKTISQYDDNSKLNMVHTENYDLEGETTSATLVTYTYTPSGKEETQVKQTLTEGEWVNTSIQRYLYDEFDRVTERQNGSWSAENGDWNITKRITFEYDVQEDGILYTVSFYKKNGEEWVWDVFANQTILFGSLLKTQQKTLRHFQAEIMNGYGNINQFEFMMSNTPEPIYLDMEEKPSFACNLHPNPTTGQVTIMGKDLKQAEVINALGQRVATVQGKGDTLQINITNLPAGVYFVNVTDSEGRKCVRKVVKE